MAPPSPPAVVDIEDLFRPAQYAQQPRIVHDGTTTTVRATATAKQNAVQFKRNLARNKTLGGQDLYHDFDLANDTTLTEQQAVQEAARCLKCADAPCQKACPTAVDVKAFITSIQNRNFYGAAQVILSANPTGYSCGTLCMTSELCSSTCNLSATRGGPINIAGLQEFALQQYAQMQIQPKVRSVVIAAQDDDKTLAGVTNGTSNGHGKPTTTPKYHVALVGAGPASISCATFLARLGYPCTLYEAQPAAGGLGQWEIPQFRLPQTAVQWELQQLLQLPHVKIQYNAPLTTTTITNDDNKSAMTVESLLETHDAVFLGIGKPKPQTIPVFQNLNTSHGYYHSKEFLKAASHLSKRLPETTNATEPLTLSGRVLVLGGGDVATDCARMAYRLGATRVTLCLRRNVTHFRATEEQVRAALAEQVDVLPYALPKQVIVNPETGNIQALELYKTEQDDATGKYDIDEDQFLRVKCDFIISAFGSTADTDLAQALQPVKYNAWNEIDVEPSTGQTRDHTRVFAGGDMIGSDTAVAAANDGKTAAWGIHSLLQNLPATTVPSLPSYTTAIDDVDLSVTICGVKFPNPFGLASAPPTTSCEMIARAFAQGWGFAVTKTFTNDSSIITNVSPRIFSPLQGAAKDQHYQEGFINIELISEKTAEYWCNGIQELKRRFPDRVVVASVMSSFEKESWQEVTRMACEAGADMIEMNLSCPHGMHEKGMGLALGVYPDKVQAACSWVVEASTVPVFAKLTPNVTDITVIAQAARDGGVDGVTAINTVSGLIGFHSDATPGRFGVGAAKTMTYGGMCGNQVRPLAFKAISAIAKRIPDFPIMATGGIDSADITLQMMYAGASVVQICSAVMNQDFTIIHDLISGLKALLYMRGSRQDLHSWDHGMPPVEAQKLAPRPKFGPLEVERRLKNAEARRVQVIVKPLDLAPVDNGEHKDDSSDPVKPLMIEDLIGQGLDHITTYSKLNNREQVVAYVNPDLCLNCGKCYSTCNDNGYQAITFDAVTHLPVVDQDKCTGCGLCESICPALHAITFQNRVGFKEPTRNKKDL